MHYAFVPTFQRDLLPASSGCLNLVQVGSEVNVLPNFFYHPVLTPEGQELISSVCCHEHLSCFAQKRRSIYHNLDMNIHLNKSFVTSSAVSSTSILFKTS